MQPKKSSPMALRSAAKKYVVFMLMMTRKTAAVVLKSVFITSLLVILSLASVLAAPFLLLRWYHVSHLVKFSTPEYEGSLSYYDYSLLVIKIFLQMVCDGPLTILFFGCDPISIVSMLQRTIRKIDSRVLRIRSPTHVVAGEKLITIPLRDGETTIATLYSPVEVDATPRPVVLIRTPYGKEGLKTWGIRFAERGYHLVCQDARGRFDSTGDFFPMLNEAADGADTIRWLEKQPWCNGNVGITGVSYLGLAAWAAMRENVPALKAVVPIFAANDIHHVVFGRGTGGTVHTELIFRWIYLVIHLMPRKPWGRLLSIPNFFLGTAKVVKDAYMHTPLDEVDTKFLCPDAGGPLPWFHDGFNNPMGTEPFWKDRKKCVDMSLYKRCAGEKAERKKSTNAATLPPVLLFCGWYDFFCSEMLYDFQELSARSRHCRMVIGPYNHWSFASMQPKMFQSLFDFFDLHLMKEDYNTVDVATRSDGPAVEAFSMGRDMKWHNLETWPPKNISTITFLLAKQEEDSDRKISKSNNRLLVSKERGINDFLHHTTLHGDDNNNSNTIKRTKPVTVAEEVIEKSNISANSIFDKNNRAAVSYQYDPANPTPNLGGATFNPMNCGRVSQNSIEQINRKDIVTFTTYPLKKPLTIVGRIKVRLNVVSDVKGTDYVARACHVTTRTTTRTEIPNKNNINSNSGTISSPSQQNSENIADGIVRCSNLVPGKCSTIEISLSPVMNRLGVGDQLRLQICSASFPKYGRHLNTIDDNKPFHLAVNSNISTQQIIVERGDGTKTNVGNSASGNDERLSNDDDDAISIVMVPILVE